MPSIPTSFMYPYSASYKSGLWTDKVIAAWLSIDGPGNVIGGGGGIILPGNNSTVARTDARLGDVWTSPSYELQSFPAELGYLDITGKIKIPTPMKRKVWVLAKQTTPPSWITLTQPGISRHWPLSPIRSKETPAAATSTMSSTSLPVSTADTLTLPTMA